MSACGSCYQHIAKDGIGRHNVVLGQWLGLCPLLAISTSAVSGIGLGLATWAVLIASNTMIACLRGLIPENLRIPIYITLIAALVTCTELIMHAFFPSLYQSLGLFLALIVTNCAILGRAEAFASRHTVLAAIVDSFAQGAGFFLVLVTMGSVREIVGQGSWLSGAEALGDLASTLNFSWQHPSSSFILALLPPGAFFTLALFAALKQHITYKRNLSARG